MVYFLIEVYTLTPVLVELNENERLWTNGHQSLQEAEKKPSHCLHVSQHHFFLLRDHAGVGR